MRVTEHLVSNGRLGRCREHGPGEDGWTAAEIVTEERTRAERIRKLRSPSAMIKRTRSIAAILCLAFLLHGCAAATPAVVNRDITTGIADAGTVAIQAEQMYQAKQIPQTTANRNAINALGAAYSDAKDSYGVFLTAEAVYNGAVSVQLAACSPAAAGTNLQVNGQPATCPAATASVGTARTQLTAAQTAYNAKITTLGTQTTAVQALTKGK